MPNSVHPFRVRVARALLFVLLFCALAPIRAHAATLSTSAASAILLEAQSGAVLYQKDADTQRKMASTTKIMTAYVVISTEQDLQKKVEVDPRAVGIEGTSVYLKAKECLTLYDLLHAVLLSSANDAAAALAYATCGSLESFADKMNAQAQAWGLSRTHFTNPHGLDDSAHYTTARELAIIARHAMQNSIFASIAATKSYTAQSGDHARTFSNHNRLLRTYEGSTGVKTGFTKKSGRCLVSAATREGVTLIAVTLNAGDDWNDHRAMLDYGFSRYERRQILHAGELSFTLPVVGGEANSVTLSNAQELWLTVPKNRVGVEITLYAPHFFFAPVEEGAHLATARITVGGETQVELPLYAQSFIAMRKKTSRLQRIRARLSRSRKPTEK